MISKKTSLLLITTCILLLCGLLACGHGDEPGFGIYLVDSGELVLSENHIKVYHGDSHTIELNEAGIEKWNSYLTYDSIPKLKESLYSRDFVLKVEGKEMYQGKFYSMVSSASYPGVVILDALIKLEGERNTIRIEYGYAWSPSNSEDDPRNQPEIIDFLTRKGLLE